MDKNVLSHSRHQKPGKTEVRNKHNLVCHSFWFRVDHIKHWYCALSMCKVLHVYYLDPVVLTINCKACKYFSALIVAGDLKPRGMGWPGPPKEFMANGRFKPGSPGSLLSLLNIMQHQLPICQQYRKESRMYFLSWNSLFFPGDLNAVNVKRWKQSHSKWHEVPDTVFDKGTLIWRSWFQSLVKGKKIQNALVQWLPAGGT